MIELPEIGLGTYGNTDPETCAQSVETALNCGYRHIDTAEMYDNESAVGDGLRRADVDRDEVVVATKVESRNLAYDDVLAAARESRERLGVDVIDLLYVHWPIRTYDPEETLAAFDRLRDEGLVGHVGLSNFTPALLEEAIDRLDAPVAAHQVECHPLLPQAELRELAREHGHTLVAYSPLAKGTVTEVPELISIAESCDATPVQVSLAWLRSKANAVAIPKATSRTHIEENYESRRVSLDDDAIDRIDEIDRRERQVDVPEAPWN